MNLNIESAILYSDVSDHLPVALRIETPTPKKVVSSLPFKRFYTNEQYDQFNFSLASVDWNEINICCDNPSKAYFFCR